MLAACAVAALARGQAATSGPTTTPAEAEAALNDAWTQVLARFAAGKDDDAVALARAATARYRQGSVARDRLLLFVAVDDRAYFGGSSASQGLPIFDAIATRRVDSAYRRAAADVVAIESKQDVPASFADLCKVATESDDETALWIAGIEARALHENERGAAAYARLLAKTNGGAPAIVHQTYANLLDELKRYDEALVQRDLSIATQPAGWNFDGKGNTLNDMGRYAEADAAYAEAMRLEPRRAKYVVQRARNAVMGGHAENGAILADRAAELAPGDGDAWYWKGRAHAALAQWPDAERALRRAVEVEPADRRSARALAEALDAQGRDNDAKAVRDKYYVEP